MQRIKPPKTEEEVKRLTPANLRKEYIQLATTMDKIINGDLIYCHKCDEFHGKNAWYPDKRYKSGLYPDCKEQLLLEATDYDKQTKTYTDNRQKTIEVFRKLDLPFIDSLYRAAIQQVTTDSGERTRSTAYQQMIVMIRSLPQYRGMDFSCSEFDFSQDNVEDEKVSKKTIKNGKKRFGIGYTDSDYQFLENEYQDWVSRYKAENKAHEDLFQLLSINKWQRREALKAGKPTKDLDKTYQDLLSSVNILPRQNSGNGLTDSLTFGQLIEKWEAEKPIPEPEPEFRDVNKIGKYIRIWFKGHLARSLGLDNGYSQEYDDYVSKYTVTKATHEDEERSEGIYNTIFGGGPNE